MGVLVLQPRDVLLDTAPHHHRRLISPPRSKQRRSSVTNAPTPAPTRSSRRKQWSPSGSPPPPPKSKSNNDNKPLQAKTPDLSTPIRILKRGEELPPKQPTKSSSADSSPVKERKTKREGSVDRANSDPAVFSAGPVLSPFIGGFYAGSAFSTSPPPSSLPVPAFCTKSAGAGCLTKSTTEDVALDLRRMLRLDL